MSAYASLKPSYCSAEPNVTEEQVKLVRASFQLVASGETSGFKMQSKYTDPAAHLVMVFYPRLFEIAPQVRPLFVKPIEQQGAMLVKMLSMSVDLLTDLPKLVPRLQSLAARHVKYGSSIDQYGAVGEALVWTLQHIAGDAFTPEMAAAWVEVYSLMLSVMIPAQLAAEQESAKTPAAAASTVQTGVSAAALPQA